MASSAPAGAIAWRREEERRPSVPGLPLFVPGGSAGCDAEHDCFPHPKQERDGRRRPPRSFQIRAA